MPRHFQIIIPAANAPDVLRVLDEDLALKNVYRMRGEAGNVFITFRSSDARAGEIINCLEAVGVGIRFGVLDVLNMTFTKPSLDEGELESASTADLGGHLAMDEIWLSVVSQTELTFDFIMYLVFAAMIAGAGLASNSSVSIVASMLVSPLMGPIVGFTFGAVVQDWKLVRLGFRNECIALFITWVIGVLYGFIWIASSWYFEWPNEEMSSRGHPWNLLVGVAVAIPSGGAVAIAVSSGGINSLVGVAISASLLPPIVDSGMLVVYGFLGPVLYGEDEVSRSHNLRLAGISFALTLVNIACIFVAGALTFMLKSVTSLKRSTDVFQEELKGFAKEDKADLWQAEKLLAKEEKEYSAIRRATLPAEGFKGISPAASLSLSTSPTNIRPRASSLPTPDAFGRALRKVRSSKIMTSHGGGGGGSVSIYSAEVSGEGKDTVRPSLEGKQTPLTTIKETFLS
mmetsp:Transcript_3103/g.4743  ORF Transcript_3103/g.4743 Transcript_3103/m.4743 type:complete len:457 (+) Transcript_3103:127-1497(+)